MRARARDLLHSIALSAWSGIAILGVVVVVASTASGCIRSAPAPALSGELARAHGAFQHLDGPAIVTFGYASCVDLCPFTLRKLDRVLRDVDAHALYVTVDPERDDVDVLRTLLASHDARIEALRPAPRDLDALLARWHVTATRRAPNVRLLVDTAAHPRAGADSSIPHTADYSIDHTADFIIVDAAGAIRARLPHGAGVDELERALTSAGAPRLAAQPDAAPALVSARLPDGAGVDEHERALMSAGAQRLAPQPDAAPALVSARRPDGAGVDEHERALMSAGAPRLAAQHDAAPAFATGTAASAAEGLRVVDVRATIMGASGAAYFTIDNSAGTEEDTLLAVSSSAAAAAELHEVVDDGGVVAMREVASLHVPAGAVVALAPGGAHHVMLHGLRKTGARLPLRLRFERAGVVDVDAALGNTP